MDENVLGDFDLLTKEGVYGFYDGCEVTSIFLTYENKLYNYFTIAVFDEYQGSANFEKSVYLTRSLLRINEQFKLGIFQFYARVPEAKEALSALLEDGKWPYQGKELLTWSRPRSLRKQFVPPNSILSSVLKENGENGSYLLELFDERKELLQQLSRADIASISAEASKHLPIRLDIVRERVGNILFQFPSKLLAYRMRATKERDGVVIDFAWHPRLVDKPMKFRVETNSVIDGSVMGHQECDLTSEMEQPLVLKSGNTEDETAIRIINMTNGLIYCSYSGMFLRGFNFSMNMGMQNSEPRTIRRQDGKWAEIPLFTPSSFSTDRTSDRTKTPYYAQIAERQEEMRILKLSANGEFRQFQPGREPDHETALDHVRTIIAKYSDKEICLWDPYTVCRDIIDTAYYSTKAPTVIRVVTAFESTKRSRKKTIIVRKGLFCRFKSHLSEYELFREEQTESFRHNSNNLGIQIEMRCCHDHFGWPFHDRFLILPQSTFANAVRVWSLGTSINSLGKAGHHVIQEVPNPNLIYDAFLELWNALSDASCIVWSYP
jgi:hypothetical protein